MHCLKKSYANIVVVQNASQLEKILKIRDLVPELKAIVQIEGGSNNKDVITVSTEAWEGGGARQKITVFQTKFFVHFQWQQLIEIGENELEAKLYNAMRNTAVNECCAILFTVSVYARRARYSESIKFYFFYCVGC